MHCKKAICTYVLWYWKGIKIGHFRVLQLNNYSSRGSKVMFDLSIYREKIDPPPPIPSMSTWKWFETQNPKIFFCFCSYFDVFDTYLYKTESNKSKINFVKRSHVLGDGKFEYSESYVNHNIYDKELKIMFTFSSFSLLHLFVF